MTTGYIVVQGWTKFQHYRNRDPIWIKLHRDLLDRDEYLSLSPSSRSLLVGIWLMSARVGNGRVPAKSEHLRSRLRLRDCNLEPLIQAGFIKLRASKAIAPRYQSATPELKGSSNEEPKEKEKEGETRARARTTRANGHHKGLTSAELHALAEAARAKEEATNR